MPTFNWVFEYKLITSEILTQPSQYERAVSKFSIPKRFPPLGPVICLSYTYTYAFINSTEVTIYLLISES